MKIHEQITPATWGKGIYGESGSEGRLSMTAWLDVTYHDPVKKSAAYKRLQAAVGIADLAGPERSLGAWEESPSVTFADVLTAFREADV